MSEEALNKEEKEDYNYMPESLAEIFDTTKDGAKQKKEVDFVTDKKVSLFNKSRGEQVDSSNVEAEKLKKAEELYNKFNIFGKMDVQQKSIQPINNSRLQQKERQKQREMNAGKAWGSMPKQELTEEVKNDLKAI